MKFGKTEIGPFGVIALILAVPAGLLIGLGYFLIGIPLLIMDMVFYYIDRLQYRKKNKQTATLKQ